MEPKRAKCEFVSQFVSLFVNVWFKELRAQLKNIKIGTKMIIRVSKVEHFISSI